MKSAYSPSHSTNRVIRYIAFCVIRICATNYLLGHLINKVMIYVFVDQVIVDQVVDHVVVEQIVVDQIVVDQVVVD